MVQLVNNLLAMWMTWEDLLEKGTATHSSILPWRIPWTVQSMRLQSQTHRQEYKEELYKKDLHDPDNHDGVITHLEPDILECEVKWALRNISISKASGGDGIPVELFQIPKDDAVKVLHSICQHIWKTQQWPQDFIPVSKKGNAKKCSNYHTIALISHASKVMFKILQDRLQSS